jgi:hypothetical protein
VKDINVVLVFCMEIPSFPVTFDEEAIFSSRYVLGAFV